MGEKYEGNAITINNLNKSKAEIIPKGNAEQETREGYNLFNPNNNIKIGASTLSISNDKFIISSSQNTQFYLFVIDNVSNYLGKTITSDFTILINNTTIDKTATGFVLCDEDGSNRVSLNTESIISDGNIHFSATIPQDADTSKKIALRLYGTGTITDTSKEASCEYTNMMVYEGDYDNTKPYEQYGEMPSPNYPSKVVTVGQNVNMFNIEGEINKSNCNYEIDNTSIVVTATYSYGYISQKIAGLTPNESYILHFEGDNASWIRITNSSGTQIKETYSAKSITFIAPDDGIVNVMIYATTSAISGTKTFKNIKLEPGTVATAYSKYGQGSVEIGVCNKNLAKINETNWELTENNTIKNKARNQGIILTEMNMKANIKYKIHLKLFSKPTTASTFTCFLNDIAQSANKTFVNINNFTLNTTYTIEFLLEEDMKFKMNFSGNTNSEIFEFQLWAEIDEATDYIPHESYTKVLPIQKEFVKIGDVEDTFVKVDDKWYEEHYIKKLTLDGTESWNWHSDGFGFTKAAGISIVPNNKVLAISNFLLGIQIGSNGTYYKDKDNVIFSWMSGNLICLKATNKFTDVETLKSWLAEQYANGTPVIVYYVLQEPKLIPCTPEQSNILDQSENTELYDGINHITAFSSIEPILEVTVKEPIEDYETYISSEGYLINNESNIKLLIDFNESNLPSMPEATESSIRAAGRNGDIVLATTYEPMTFDIVCYTEDNLTQAEKTIEEKKINKFLNSIKNKTITLAFENDRKFYNVKYSGALVTTNFPKHLKFSIPLKSSESYGRDLIEKSIVGNDTGESDTIENAGALITINGPAIKPIISLNDYSIEYDMDILEGAKIEIDSSKSTITHINSDGIKTNVMKYYNHQFPKIENGTNQLKILSGISNANNVIVKWNDLKL